MCIECEAINAKIGHFRGLAKAVTDPMTLKGIDVLVAKLEGDKAVLHRPREREPEREEALLAPVIAETSQQYL